MPWNYNVKAKLIAENVKLITEDFDKFFTEIRPKLANEINPCSGNFIFIYV